mmetsp:Transcript_81009/g.127793  ORF Transcript_81009/g.127793 Transcript_81009/m.127793 type:complete len:207 (-) Transcript_81009:434-1054(-)
MIWSTTFCSSCSRVDRSVLNCSTIFSPTFCSSCSRVARSAESFSSNNLNLSSLSVCSSPLRPFCCCAKNSSNSFLMSIFSSRTCRGSISCCTSAMLTAFTCSLLEDSARSSASKLATSWRWHASLVNNESAISCTTHVRISANSFELLTLICASFRHLSWTSDSKLTVNSLVRTSTTPSSWRRSFASDSSFIVSSCIWWAATLASC